MYISQAESKHLDLPHEMGPEETSAQTLMMDTKCLTTEGPTDYDKIYFKILIFALIIS